MPLSPRTHRLSAMLLATVLATACGGGGGGDSTAAAATTQQTTSAASDAGAAPIAKSSAVTAVVGIGEQEAAALAYINDRREQLGLPRLALNTQLYNAALSHTRYTLLNNAPGHDEVTGNTGFTGADLAARLTYASYSYQTATEVFSRSSDEDSAQAVESLLAAIYHRFAMFRSDISEAGAGSARAAGDREVPIVDVTVDMGSTSGNQPMPPAAGTTYAYPFNGQADAPIDFMSDAELPDPVPTANRVGYPISIQCDPRSTLSVSSFTVKALGGSRAGQTLTTQLLKTATNPNTPSWAAAIIPLDPLEPATRYEVSFLGHVNGQSVTRTWTFTTAAVATLSVTTPTTQIASGQAAVFTMSGGVGSALEKVTYVRSGDVSVSPIDIRLLSNTRFSLTANGQCPNSCSATAVVKDRDGREARATITVVQ